MPYLINKNMLWLERFVIFCFTATYLFFFQRQIYSGDALVYVNHIKEGLLVWNPNHLLMDPLGYAWFHLLQNIGFSISIIDSFKWISGIATVISLLIFHKVLLELNVRSSLVRLLSVAGLFASKNFLLLGVSEEFFMIQMPFLATALLFSIKWLKNSLGYKSNVKTLVVIGSTIAITVVISIHNIVLLFLLGIFVMFKRTGSNNWSVRNTVWLWGTSFLVICSVFMVVFFMSETPEGFVTWLTSYQGVSENPSGTLYGVERSIKGIAISASRLVFNFFTNLVDAGGLGTVLSSIVFSHPLEFVPSVFKVTLGIALLISIIVLIFILFIWIVRYGMRLPLTQFGIVWIVSYLLFNFFWNDSSDQFWFQLLPIMWVIILQFSGVASLDETFEPIKKKKLIEFSLLVFSCVLLIFNSLQSIIPLSFVDMEGNTLKHKQLLREDDMEIIPGWDDLRWISLDSSFPSVKRLVLVDMALKSAERKESIAKLPDIIDKHLSQGKRVIVARLYDLDHVQNPWSGLMNLGWSRSKIQESLQKYCTEKIGRIDDVVFREIKKCKSG